jgi:hypothetical protein
MVHDTFAGKAVPIGDHDAQITVIERRQSDAAA